MLLSQRYRRLPEFREGMRDQIGVSAGIAAMGLMTGVAMSNSGLSAFESVAMVFLVYAGSAQLAALPLLAADAPAWVIWATALCVNLRFVVFSAHLRAYLMHLPRGQRLTAGFLTVDLSYVFLSQRFPHPAESGPQRDRQVAYLMGNSAVNCPAWMVPSLLGVALAQQIPLEWGLGFAGILGLLGIGCALVNTRLKAVSAVVASAAAVSAWALPLKLNILVGIACAVAVCMVLESLSRPADQDGGRHHGR